MRDEDIVGTALDKAMGSGLDESDLYNPEAPPIPVEEGDPPKVIGWWVKLEVFVSKEEVG